MQNYFEKVGNLSLEERKQLRKSKIESISIGTAALGLAVLLGYCLPHGNPFGKTLETKATIATDNQIEYSQNLVSNYCNTLIEFRKEEFVKKEDSRWGLMDARKEYITKLGEIIASLQGDNYSQATYAAAKEEYHKVAKKYAEYKW